MSKNISNRLFKTGIEFLNVKYPILCGAMTWVSNPKLVAAVANAGAFGCLAGGNMSAKLLELQVKETRKLTDKPFGINLLTIAPAYHEQLYLAQWMKFPYVIFAGSFPKKSEIKLVKESGAKVICYASTNSIAQRMVRYGADALILEGSEAGGHVGRVSLSVLLQQVLFDKPDVPILVGGGIAGGRMCAHLLLMGAAGIIMGSRFATAKESCAHPEFKKIFLNAHSRDAVAIPQYDRNFPIVAVRTLHNSGLEDFKKIKTELTKKLKKGKMSRTKAQKIVSTYWNNALKEAVVNGNIKNGALMAGQSVGLVNNILSVQEIIDEIITDIEQELTRVKHLL